MVLALWVGALVVVPGPGLAGVPVVYDESAGPTGTKELGASDFEFIDLIIDGGPIDSDVEGEGDPIIICQNADGDELCGIDLTVIVEGDGRIVDYFLIPDTDDGGDGGGGGATGTSPDPPPPFIVHHPDGEFAPTSMFRLNVLQAEPFDPPSTGPIFLGTLVLDTFDNGPLTATVTASGQFVAADGTLGSIPSRVIADRPVLIPEPPGVLMLWTGIAGLALLHRLRKRKS
jgi:hypothetical protein